jgi:hypothetical protein
MKSKQGRGREKRKIRREKNGTEGVGRKKCRCAKK